MTKKVCLVMSMAAVIIAVLVSPCAGNAQAIGVGAKPDPAGNPAAKSFLLLNREPMMSLDLKKELVEILPGGINVLAAVRELDAGTRNPDQKFIGGMRVGGNSLDGLRIAGNSYVYIGTRLLQLDRDGIVLEVKVTNEAKTVLASRKLLLSNYEEALVELATASEGNKRLAVRFLPSIRVIEPLREFPVLIERFGTGRGLLIRNSREVIMRGGCSGSIDDLNGPKQQFNTLESRNSGLLVISYRPFPGAVIAGYAVDKELKFEWNGDFYEWISLDKPFLPEGRWAIYVWQAGPGNYDGVSFGGFESDPNDIRSYLELRQGRMGGIGGVKK